MMELPYILCDQMGESIYGRCVESGQTIVIDNVAEVISPSGAYWYSIKQHSSFL